MFVFQLYQTDIIILDQPPKLNLRHYCESQVSIRGFYLFVLVLFSRGSYAGKLVFLRRVPGLLKGKYKVNNYAGVREIASWRETASWRLPSEYSPLCLVSTESDAFSWRRSETAARQLLHHASSQLTDFTIYQSFIHMRGLSVCVCVCGCTS